MLYPQNIEIKIGFDQIRDLLRDLCLGPLGVDSVDQLSMTSESNAIAKSLDQASEFSQIISQKLEFPHSGYLDFREALTKVAISGMFLSLEEFQDLKAVLNTLNGWRVFLDKHKEDFPELHKLSRLLTIDKQLFTVLDQVVDERGQIRDGASPELKRIRHGILSNQKKARNAIERFLKQCINSNYSNSDSTVSIRNGRLVIPVIAQYKRNVQGFIHDESSSGQTSYIEPAEVLELNNEITDLEYQERREVVKILTRLTDQVRPHIPELESGLGFLGAIDFIQSKSRLALKLKATRPELVDHPSFEWRKAKHPLLFLAYQKQKKWVVPLDLTMSTEKRILIISGPNAGGKSVCLKTVALVQYMLQCGLLVPLEEGSTMTLFKDIFIDIGDEQSIENDLSTYSSHIKNMSFLIRHTSKDSLFLIDEFGTGTDPQFGGSIAEAVLENLNERLGFGIITTHYSNLKKMADEAPGIVNAAMRFNREKMEPLYELEIGNPGSSFSLEIARKMGLPSQVLEQAEKKVGFDQVKLDQILSDLEKEKSDLEKERNRLNQNNRELKDLIADYRSKSNSLESEKKGIIAQAKSQAKDLLDQSNRRIESTIREIKESRADKLATKRARQELDRFKGGIHPEKLPAKQKTDSSTIDVGDRVQIEGQETIGEVLQIFKKDAEVVIGALKSTVKLSRLSLVEKKVETKRHQKIARKYGMDLTLKAKSFSSDLDLRGKRTDEALTEVDRCLDDALLLGVDRVRIIHGKGYGILREVIRKHLDNAEYVSEIRDEENAQGGAGVSIVYLK